MKMVGRSTLTESQKIYNEINAVIRKKEKDIVLSDYLSGYVENEFSKELLGEKNAYYHEFFAEAFANMECGKPNIIGETLKEWLEGVLQ